MNITEISKLRNKFEDFMAVYTKKSAEIILYGAGNGADWVIDLLETKRIFPSAIVDKMCGGGYTRGIPIISLENLITQYGSENIYIVIASPKYEEEISDLLKAHFQEEDIFSFECELYYHYIHDIDDYRKYLQDKEEDFKKLYARLADDTSKLTLENVLKGRISGELKFFREVFVEDQYFAKDIVKLGKEEVLLDVGAYIGDTVEYIVQKYNDNYKKIYCFEPDQRCVDELKKNVEKYENVEIIAKGAWNKYEKMFIQEDSAHGASSISKTEGYEIEVDCIDNCIGEEERVTHIKMDIEGAELSALQGAKRVIQTCKPKLAICVYHKNEDILEISDYLLSIVPDYKLYLRHHNISGTETVLYAIYD